MAFGWRQAEREAAEALGLDEDLWPPKQDLFVREWVELEGEQQEAALKTSTRKAKELKDALDQKMADISSSQVVFKHPAYWSRRSIQGGAFFHHRHTTGYMKSKMQSLLRKTVYSGHGGGCGVPMKPSLANATVTRVVRNENSMLWRKYCIRKAEIKEMLRAQSSTASVNVPQHDILDKTLNEVYLFHGCPPDPLEAICKFGFDERVSSMSG